MLTFAIYTSLVGIGSVVDGLSWAWSCKRVRAGGLVRDRHTTWGIRLLAAECLAGGSSARR